MQLKNFNIAVELSLTLLTDFTYGSHYSFAGFKWSTLKHCHAYTVYIFRAAQVLQCHLCVNCDRRSWSSYASQQELQVVAPHKLWLTICPRQFSHLPTSEITFEIPGENYLWHHFDVDFTALSGLLTCDLSKRSQLCLGQNMIRWQAKSLPRRKRLWKMWTNWRSRRRFQIQIVRSHHRRLQIDGLDTSHLQNSDRKWRRGIPPENWHQKPVKRF